MSKYAGRTKKNGVFIAALGTLVVTLSLIVYLNDGRAHITGQSGDNRSNQLLPISLLSGDGFAFDRLFSDGEELHYAFRRANGHVVSMYPIVPGLLNTVTYAVALHLEHPKPLQEDAAYLSLITGSVVTALSVGVIYLLLVGEGLGAIKSFGLSLAYAFGTSAFSVASRGIWQHGPALLFLSIGMLLLRRHSDRLVALAGLSLGLAVESRVPVVLLVLPLFWIPWQRGVKCLLAFTLAFSIPIALMRIYAWYYWGDPFVLAENMRNANASMFIVSNALEGMAGVLLSPGRGLFVYSPFLLFGAIGLIAALRQRDGFYISVALGVLLYILSVATYWHWWNGFTFGTRYLTETLPGGILLAAKPIIDWWDRGTWRRAIVAATIGWSVLVNYAGARHFPQLAYGGWTEEHRRVWTIRDNELAACLGALHARAASHIYRVFEGVSRGPS
jgi:hypothetical protein